MKAFKLISILIQLSEIHGAERVKNVSDFKELYFIKIMRILICCWKKFANGYVNFSGYEIFL